MRARVRDLCAQATAAQLGGPQDNLLHEDGALRTDSPLPMVNPVTLGEDIKPKARHAHSQRVSELPSGTVAGPAQQWAGQGGQAQPASRGPRACRAAAVAPIRGSRCDPPHPSQPSWQGHARLADRGGPCPSDPGPSHAWPRHTQCAHAGCPLGTVRGSQALSLWYTDTCTLPTPEDSEPLQNHQLLPDGAVLTGAGPQGQTWARAGLTTSQAPEGRLLQCVVPPYEVRCGTSHLWHHTGAQQVSDLGGFGLWNF